MKKIFILIIILFAKISTAETTEAILKKIDSNMRYKSIKYTGIMEINKHHRRKKIKTFTAIIKGTDKAFIEFINPEDRGTKFLKLGDELWIKGAFAEQADKISGHLLKNSLMGSDFSYEDTMENESLNTLYKSKIIGEEKINNHMCYKLELTAKKKKISYPKLIIWADKEKYIILKEQFFALSGLLLKEMSVLKVKKINNKYIPVKIKMENKQRKNSYTILKMKNISVNQKISDRVFSKRNLEK